jgi:hypothetical protein
MHRRSALSLDGPRSTFVRINNLDQRDFAERRAAHDRFNADP